MIARVLQAPRRLMAHSQYGEFTWAYLFLLPTLVLFGLFTFYPVFGAVVTSMQAFTGFNASHPFVGLQNYERVLFSEPVFWKSIYNTVLFTAGTIPVAVLLPLGLAVLIDRLVPGLQTFFKSAFYLPGVVSSVVVGLMWVWILSPFRAGLANWGVGLFGLGPFVWLGETHLALPSLMATVWFSGHGASVILYLAAMGAIPSSLYEAADLDCASTWSKFRNVTWPLIMPTTLFVLVTSTIGSFQVFDLVYTMTAGGPELSTSTIVYYIYRVAFRNFEFGLASAAAVILGVVIVAVSLIQFRFLSTEVEY